MPTYVYEASEATKSCPHCKGGFEARHGMSEPALADCPKCGAPVRRVFTPPGLPLRWNEKATLSDANLKRHGFKKLRNEGGGKFRVT